MALMECVRGERPGVFNNRLFHRAFERLVSPSSAFRPGLVAPSALPCSVGKQAHVSFCAGHCSWGRACQP